MFDESVYPWRSMSSSSSWNSTQFSSVFDELIDTTDVAVDSTSTDFEHSDGEHCVPTVDIPASSDLSSSSTSIASPTSTADPFSSTESSAIIKEIFEKHDINNPLTDPTFDNDDSGSGEDVEEFVRPVRFPQRMAMLSENPPEQRNLSSTSSRIQ